MRGSPAVQLTLFCYAAYALFAALVIEDWYLRYRIPLEVMLTVFAGVGYADGWARWRRTNSSKTAAIRSP